jgi:ABC-type sugar transport system ATPase subunit
LGDGGHGRGNVGKGSALDQEVATTMIYVALDQVEAMTLADSMVDINLRRAVLFDLVPERLSKGHPDDRRIRKR